MSRGTSKASFAQTLHGTDIYSCQTLKPNTTTPKSHDRQSKRHIPITRRVCVMVSPVIPLRPEKSRLLSLFRLLWLGIMSTSNEFRSDSSPAVGRGQRMAHGLPNWTLCSWCLDPPLLGTNCLPGSPFSFPWFPGIWHQASSQLQRL